MKRTFAPSIALMILLAACASTDDPASVASVVDSTTTLAAAEPPTTTTTAVAVETGFPVTVTSGSGEITIAAKPTAIVSLSPASTEILFAVGAGDQVLAVDSLSNFPQAAPLDPDLSAWTPNVEAIIGMGPDLVVVSGATDDLIDGLNAAGIAVLVHPAPADINGVYDQIEQVGVATGNIAEAAALVAQMRTEIADIVAGVPQSEEPPTYYHELDNTLYSVTSQTFIGQIYALLGLENVADPADLDGSSYGYPQLSAEYLVDADPDFIFLADTICCAVTADSLAERPGWEALSAVQDGRIVELSDDIASRWGPRVVDLLRAVADAMATAEVSNG
ncbi:MAG: ABC transporter substrate-binding protein [Acidimicrobiia bacterium]|nr:ABC transporter substrate-binding protein [Acidimicrobiia bacterium]